VPSSAPRQPGSTRAAGTDRKAGTESDEEVRLLTYDEAVSLLPDRDQIHAILDGDVALLGADWDRAGILKLLATADQREVTGPQARAHGHGLAAWLGNVPVFIETKQETDSGHDGEAARQRLRPPAPESPPEREAAG
jgi:hypothetical protein